MPSPVDMLQKFLRLEINRKYDNRAVVGGLTRYMEKWISEAEQNHLPASFIQRVAIRLEKYEAAEPAVREVLVQETLSLLNRVPEAESELAAPSQPAQPSRQQSVGSTEPARPAGYESSARAEAPAAPAIQLDTPVQGLPNIGEATAAKLAALGVETIQDLLYYFPRRYDDYSKFKSINRLQPGEELSVIATVKSCSTRPIKSGKMRLTEAILVDGTGTLRLYYFNQPHIANQLRPGANVIVAGKVEQYLGRPKMTNAKVEDVDKEHLTTGGIIPVYPASDALPQGTLRRTIRQNALALAPRVPDPLPSWVRSAENLLPLPQALYQIHGPKSEEQIQAARERLAFDEIFLLQLGVLKQKKSWKAATAQVFAVDDSFLDEFSSHLPFQLTSAQSRAMQDVRADLASGQPMNRLLQGDVGSGKTVVAAAAAAIIAANQSQTAILAPTGILAEQHYRSFRGLLAEGEQPMLHPDQVRLLVGETPDAEKADIRQGLAEGSIRVVIGTHALLEEPVEFQRLQLAVIDEQHRFGVAQRAALRAKGDNPHLLVMTATPIPRSLALTVYGDLDLTVMDELPEGRQPVATYVVPPRERERVYQLIRSQVESGRQAFIIYPLIEQNEDGDRLAATTEFERLSNEIFPGFRIGLLHGRLKAEEKDEVMLQFRAGEYQILVSTTVVEVGVDVPNATVMLIEGANRFGLAQLHQLRGRVGRGVEKSFCILIPESEDALENERLSVMAETNDGFVLAERDLQQRGPGEFLGTRQAGYAEQLKLANITDARLIERARRQAEALFERDAELAAPEQELLRRRLSHFWSGGKGDIS